MQTLLLAIAGLAFLMIVLEDVIHINKAKTTLFLVTALSLPATRR
jgi:hypothetical protein